MRPIDGDRLIDALESAKKNRGIEVDLVYSLFQQGIRQLPTLTLDDLRPKGRWIYVDPVSPAVRCSVCGSLGGWDSCGDYPQVKSTFCPECGADMRGGGEDD